MRHLNERELVRLAGVTFEQMPYSAHEKMQMKHLRECESCFTQFCGALALLEAVSKEGLEWMAAGIQDDTEEDSEERRLKKLVALINVTVQQVMGGLSVMMKQERQETSGLAFEPVLSFATRGGEENTASVYQLENIDNERTKIIYDAEGHTVMIQMDAEDLDGREAVAYIVYSEDRKEEIPLNRQGDLIRGMAGNIPEADFKIQIEYR